MSVWNDALSAEIQKFHKGGMGANLVGFGKRPALIIVDMSYCFVSSDSPMGNSSSGIPTTKAIGELRDKARLKNIPVIYTTTCWKDNKLEKGWWKRTPEVEKVLKQPKTYEIVDELKPLPKEPVLIKRYPSAFFGTHLASMLTIACIDTLIVTGMVTSGCIYATALDGFCHGYRIIIPEECVGDRAEIFHQVALFNFHMKYGDVLPKKEVIAYLDSLKLD